MFKTIDIFFNYFYLPGPIGLVSVVYVKSKSSQNAFTYFSAAPIKPGTVSSLVAQWFTALEVQHSQSCEPLMSFKCPQDAYLEHQVYKTC